MWCNVAALPPQQNQALLYYSFCARSNNNKFECIYYNYTNLNLHLKLPSTVLQYIILQKKKYIYIVALDLFIYMLVSWCNYACVLLYYILMYLQVPFRFSYIHSFSGSVQENSLMDTFQIIRENTTHL